MFNSVFVRSYARVLDIIDHGILLRKLEFCGITGSALGMIRSCLSDRNKKCQSGGLMSTAKRVTRGICCRASARQHTIFDGCSEFARVHLTQSFARNYVNSNLDLVSVCLMVVIPGNSAFEDGRGRIICLITCAYASFGL